MKLADGLDRKRSGVYAIHNSVNGRHYIGSAVSIVARTRDHASKLTRGIHENKHLQNAFNAYGTDVFWIQVIEIVDDKTQLTDREQFYLDSTRPYYNILRVARSGLGFKHSPEERERIAFRMRGKFSSMTEEERSAHVLRIGFTMKGKNQTAQAKEKIRQSHVGKVMADETKVKLAAWRADPANQTTIQNAIALRADKKASVWYVVTTPEGIEHQVRNLSEFCRLHDLSQGHLSSASLGLRKGYKGWLCRYRDNPITYDDSHKPRYEVGGKMLTVSEIAALLGLHKNTVRYHINKIGIDSLIRTHRHSK